MGLQKKKGMELGLSQHWGRGSRAGSGRTSAQAEKDMFTASSWTHLWLRLSSCGVWGWEDSSVCEKESVPGKTNKKPPGDGPFRCCWAIPSAWYCFCLGLPARAPAWHPTMARKEHFVLSSAVRQRKARLSRWHVCMPKACVCLMWVVGTASPEVHTCSVPEQALGTLSKNFPCPAFAFPTAV